LSYQRDHRVRGGENDKAFRRKWPLKKRKATRAFRHAVEARARAALLDADADHDVRTRKRPWLIKWGVTKLGDHVADQLRKRPTKVGAKQARRQR